MDNKERSTRSFPKSKKSRIYGGDSGGAYSNLHAPIARDKATRDTLNKNREESTVKREIFDIIYQYVYNDKSTLDLINYLNSIERFEKYAQFFGTWIEDTQVKKQKIIGYIKDCKKKGRDSRLMIETLSIKYKGSGKYLANLIEKVEKEESETEYDDNIK